MPNLVCGWLEGELYAFSNGFCVTEVWSLSQKSKNKTRWSSKYQLKSNFSKVNCSCWIFSKRYSLGCSIRGNSKRTKLIDRSMTSIDSLIICYVCLAVTMVTNQGLLVSTEATNFMFSNLFVKDFWNLKESESASERSLSDLTWELHCSHCSQTKKPLRMTSSENKPRFGLYVPGHQA